MSVNFDCLFSFVVCFKWAFEVVRNTLGETYMRSALGQLKLAQGKGGFYINSRH